MSVETDGFVAVTPPGPPLIAHACSLLQVVPRCPRVTMATGGFQDASGKRVTFVSSHELVFLWVVVRAKLPAALVSFCVCHCQDAAVQLFRRSMFQLIDVKISRKP